MEPSEYSWKYTGQGSSGAKFKHTTAQTKEEVIAILDECGIMYSPRDEATMLVLYGENKKFYYYYTTGRWSTEGKGHKKHYYSKGINDFLTRFFK
jgi:hypothetical protein